MSNFESLCKKLENKIKESYEEGVTAEQAEKLAGEFLGAQMIVSHELKNADLDSRMKKTGVKAIKAAVYKEICSKADKKPTEGALEHELNHDKMIQLEQDALDAAEVNRDNLTRYYNIFREGHIHFRGIAKGSFGG